MGGEVEAPEMDRELWRMVFQGHGEKWLTFSGGKAILEQVVARSGVVRQL